LVREYRSGIAEKMPTEGNRLIEGTPWFMPPEAIEESAPVDPRSDLYSLGALGYYLLTGRYIFDAETLAEVYDKQLNTAPIPPSQRTTQPVSAELEQLLLRCLEKDLAARPASALELRAQLLVLSAAAEWPVAARNVWWDAYEQQMAAETQPPASTNATPLPTVRINLEERVESSAG
jgi:serine/threonine protein kinase